MYSRILDNLMCPRYFPIKWKWRFSPLKLNHAQLSIANYISIVIHFRICFLLPTPVFFTLPVTNYMLLYSTLLCKKIARAPGGYKKYKLTDLFRLCPPSLVGAYYLQPPDTRAIFLHSNLLCNGTCSVTGGRITYWGAQTEKIQAH